MVTSIIFVKSAMSDSSVNLSVEEKKQVSKTAKFLEGVSFSKVFSNESKNAIETAELLGGNEVFVRSELFEFNKIVFEEEPEQEDIFNENIERALKSKAFFEEILRDNRDSKVLIVAHRNVIRYLVCCALKLKPHSSPNIFINNSSVTHLFFDGSDLISVGCINSTAHLFLDE